MSELPNRADIALNAPSQQWINHMAALGQVYDVVARLPGASAPQTCVISAGAIIPESGAIVVDTESEAASDDLNNISIANLPEGALVFVRGLNSSRVVTLRDQAGGNGEFKLNDGDFALDASDKWIILERRGSVWHEVIRGPVSVRLSDATPLALGVAAAGIGGLAAREDHVHPRGALIDGPASAVANHVPKFADSTGKVLADGYTVGTAAGNLVQLDENGKLPKVDGSQLLNISINNRVQVFTSSGTFAVPSSKVKFTVIGGGGKGVANGGGGGAGGCAIYWADNLTVGGTLDITVGTAKSGSKIMAGSGLGVDIKANPGEDGAEGSSSGSNPPAYYQGYGGNGGTADNGHLNITGGRGGNGFKSWSHVTGDGWVFSTAFIVDNMSGVGGSSIFGNGSYGAGGSCYSGSSGQGQPGVVICEWME